MKRAKASLALIHSTNSAGNPKRVRRCRPSKHASIRPPAHEVVPPAATVLTGKTGRQKRTMRSAALDLPL